MPKILAADIVMFIGLKWLQDDDKTSNMWIQISFIAQEECKIVAEPQILPLIRSAYEIVYDLTDSVKPLVTFKLL